MAEVRKREDVKEYKIDRNANRNKTTTKKKEVIHKKRVSEVEEKKSLWVKFRIFCHGVKSEFFKVHWPSKRDMIKYSVSTIFFVVFCSLFFYLINVIFAFVQSLF